LLKKAKNTLAIYDSFGLDGKKVESGTAINEGENKVSNELKSYLTGIIWKIFYTN